MVLLPILSLRRDADREIGLPFFNGRNLLSYLTELTLVIQEKGIPLKPSAIDIVLSQLVYSSRKHIIVEGDNLPDYPYWAELKHVLANYNNKYTYKVRYNNPIKNVGSCSGITLFVDFPVDYKAFQTSLDLYGTDLLISFQIQSEHDYDEAWLLIERNSLKNYNFIPKYNGNNRDFFQRYVFLKEQDIFSNPISFREIFCHQKINTHYFGKLIVFPNGSVKTAKYSIVIGNIGQDPVAKLVYKELKYNTSWRKIRNERPCCNCLYQYLCPSPSDYEFELGLTNLCHVFKR
jgi:pseudo-rSAM protein